MYHLVTGSGGLRERLRASLAELAKCEPLARAATRDQYEATAVKALPGMLAEGRKLAGLSQRQCEELAWAGWAAHQAVSEILTRRAAMQHEEC